MKRFHPSSDSATGSQSSPTGAHLKPRKERSKLACNECRRKKLKCDNSHPCETCRVKNLPCTVSDASRPPGRPKTGQSELSKRASTHDDTFEIPRLPHIPTAMVQDIYEPESTAVSLAQINDTPGNHVLLLNNLSSAELDLSRVPETTDLSMDDPTSITVDAMEAAFPNEAILIDESWDHPHFLDGFDWQLPTLVSLKSIRFASAISHLRFRVWSIG